MVDPGDVSSRQLKFSCARVFRGVLRMRGLGYGEESGAADHKLESDLTRSYVVHFGDFLQHLPTV